MSSHAIDSILHNTIELNFISADEILLREKAITRLKQMQYILTLFTFSVTQRPIFYFIYQPRQFILTKEKFLRNSASGLTDFPATRAAQASTIITFIFRTSSDQSQSSNDLRLEQNVKNL